MSGSPVGATFVPRRSAAPLGPPRPDVRVTRSFGRSRPTGPGAAEQEQRLGPVFSRLRESLETERLSLTDEPAATAPEYVLVLEVAGEMDEFVAAVAKVEGLEYLAEELGDKLDDTSMFAAVDTRSDRRTPLRRELFVVASDERAARELERLWALWRAGRQLPRGWATWRTVFERLVTVRQWDDRDRLERTGAADAWRAELAEAADEQIPFEVELWFRTDAERRIAERDRLSADLSANGGRRLGEFVFPEIAYHGVLAQLPASTLLATAHTMSVAWASGRGIRFLRAAGQTGVPVSETPETRSAVPRAAALAVKAPRIALLDGLPLAGHDLLAGRLVVDDPDGWEETIAVRHRQHGTGMASAILLGDLGAGEEPLDETLYVRPIIRVDPRYDWVPDPQETIPVERLPVEVVHEAVVRMKESDDATAANVRLINVSIGDRAQQMDRFVSPWARLLDYLSASYDVLFLVSAGNHPVTLVLPHDIDLADSGEVESETLAYLAQTAGLRRLLAPAESVNALTIGGSEMDASAFEADGRIAPIATPGAGAVYSSWGAGHGRAIKPDVLAPGGRQTFDVMARDEDGEHQLIPSQTTRSPGIEVATPGAVGTLDRTTWIHGTSPATALATRTGGKILGRLDALRHEWGTAMPGPEFDAVLVKALIVHGATWGQAERAVRDALRATNGSASKEDLGRALGYGLLRTDWPLVDDDHRVTALYASRLGDGTHDYLLPLPPSLAGRTDWRRITVTLAWITPMNVAHRGYRRAKLRVDATGSLGLARARQEASNNAVVRGTVQHEILEGTDAVPYADGDDLRFTITGSAGAGPFDDTVPYAFVVTLETAEGVGLPIHAEVTTRLRARAARIRA
jgi:subtilase family protein